MSGEEGEPFLGRRVGVLVLRMVKELLVERS